MKKINRYRELKEKCILFQGLDYNEYIEAMILQDDFNTLTLIHNQPLYLN